ncbi:MAG: hypothetical protein F6K16_01445 [Symploca sp. SIO2B6]|nr:hypothetical protein [Symploca sp. SIO2B6]
MQAEINCSDRLFGKISRMRSQLTTLSSITLLTTTVERSQSENTYLIPPQYRQIH